MAGPDPYTTSPERTLSVADTAFSIAVVRAEETNRPPAERLFEDAIFVWEGVVGYIDDAAIHESLSFMASAGGPGTRLVFTYVHFDFETDTVTARTRRAGFHSCDEVAGDDLWRRYLPGEPAPTTWVMKLATAIV